MRSFKRNENRDISLINNNISISTDLEACIQACESAVSTMLKEQIYSQDEGVPNFGLIWSGVPNYKQAELSIRTTIESVENVIEVTEFNYIVNNNFFEYNIAIKTIFGIGKIYNGL